MVRLLKSTLADKPEDFGAVLTEEILAVDQQLLQVERLTNEFSGKAHGSFRVRLSSFQEIKKVNFSQFA